MYDPNVGRFLSEDPIGFAGQDANKHRYVGNEPTTYVDPDGQTRQRAAQNRKNAAAAAKASAMERARMFYLRALMAEILERGKRYLFLCDSRFPGFPHADFKALEDHIRYAIEKTNGGSVNVWDGSSQNWPFLPGIAVDRESFYGGDEIAVTVIIHEWMHNFTREGLFHDNDYFNGVSINDLVGPYSKDNSFIRLIWFFRTTKCEDGTSIWGQIRSNAKQRAAEMMQDANDAAREAWERRVRARRGYGSGGRR